MQKTFASDFAQTGLERAWCTNNQKAHLSQDATLPVVPICRTSPALRCRANQNDALAHPAPEKEGRLAIVTDVGSGMRWTHIAGRNCCATSDACADGEVVWSWRSDAGAKSAVRSADDGGNQAWSPRRSRISRNTIAQGMPAVAVYPWLLTPVLSFCTGGHGCNAHPAFPAPSFDFEGGSFPTPRTFRAARTNSRASLGRHAPRKRGIQYAAAFRFNHSRLWNTGSPGHPRSSRGQAPGDDENRVGKADNLTLVDICSVMPGLVPGIHVFLCRRSKNVDGRDRPGHDGVVLRWGKKVSFRATDYFSHSDTHRILKRRSCANLAGRLRLSARDRSLDHPGHPLCRREQFHRPSLARLWRRRMRGEAGGRLAAESDPAGSRKTKIVVEDVRLLPPGARGGRHGGMVEKWR